MFQLGEFQFTVAHTLRLIEEAKQLERSLSKDFRTEQVSEDNDFYSVALRHGSTMVGCFRITVKPPVFFQQGSTSEARKSLHLQAEVGPMVLVSSVQSSSKNLLDAVDASLQEFLGTGTPIHQQKRQAPLIGHPQGRDGCFLSNADSQSTEELLSVRDRNAALLSIGLAECLADVVRMIRIKELHMLVDDRTALFFKRHKIPFLSIGPAVELKGVRRARIGTPSADVLTLLRTLRHRMQRRRETSPREISRLGSDFIINGSECY